ncbi:MAG TPA: bifunctional nuclease family protein [Acidimicrobiales bacterium]|nr:bifunctional nuclease family protein [Acidimicrobiales bacterium]
MFLQEADGARRSLPIFIGPPEATAIAFALQGIPASRPMTHDLMKDLLDTLGATVVRVVVTELRDSTFYAEIHLQGGSQSFEVSSRPSDAIALAIRTGSPLFVSDELMDAEGVFMEVEEEEEQAGGDEDGANPDELVGQFREFLDQVRPEDFSAGSGGTGGESSA